MHFYDFSKFYNKRMFNSTFINQIVLNISSFFFFFHIPSLQRKRRTRYKARYICEDSKDYAHRGEEDKVRFNER